MNNNTGYVIVIEELIKKLVKARAELADALERLADALEKLEALE